MCKDAAGQKPMVWLPLAKATGQSLLDYILLFAIVVAALLIMGYYIRNSLSGKYREAADVFGQGEAYKP